MSAKDHGLTIVTDEVYTPPLTDATTMVQHVRSSRPDFVVFQSTNVPDDKLLVDKFAEFNLTQRPAAEDRRRRPLGGAGGAASGRRREPRRRHGRPRQLARASGRPISRSASWNAPSEPWFGHDSIFAYVHVMILKEALERSGVAERARSTRRSARMDMTDGPALFFPDGALEV